MNGRDIQVEGGGFTRIHNLILESLGRVDMGGYEFRCVFYLLRATYGFQKKEMPISLDEWEKATRLDRRHVTRALKNLVAWKVIRKTSTGTGRGHTTIWAFNKYIEQWDVPVKGANTEPIDENKGADMAPFSEENSAKYAPFGDDKGANMAPFENDKGCQNTHVKGAKSGSSHTSPKESKEIKAAVVSTNEQDEAGQNAAAAAFSDEGQAKIKGFVEEYQRVWALLISSEYERDKVEDWSKRVTLPVWTFALQECADSRKVGHWKYFESILRRVEREGLPETVPKAQSPPASVNGSIGFSLSSV